MAADAACRVRPREWTARFSLRGIPETVARKIASTVRAVGASRFDLKYSAGPLAHDKLMAGIELYGTQVIPRVRELLAE